ncbi:UTP--glucose-1-phosphate uridylyltransferase [Salix suchowensis]|nr:UTP--glucose-1-phosphate uridylyltransferase [Salix suchowensis]
MTLHSIIIQKLLTTNAHIGRRVAAHHLKIYTYGMRNQVSIIDSDKTLICLRSAASFISHLAHDKNARFMFVNTNPLFDEIVEQMTKKMGIYSPRDNIMWRMGGFLTNSYSPKKFRSRNKKVCFGPIQPPDCVVVLDTERKSSVILESDRLQVPIVALVDSNMPWEIYKKIAYPVPANDSVQFVYLFCNIITKTFLLEKKKLKALKGHSRKEEQDLSNKELSKEIQESVQSKNKSNISSPIGEVLVVPYQNLAPTSDDIAEIKNLLDKIVVVKFNDTLGTAVGFNGPKSLIGIRDGLTSLDLIVNQIQSLNLTYGCHIPLVLMNTIRTHDDSLKALEKYSMSNVDILPLSQGQHPQKKSSDGQSIADELYPSDHAAAFLSLMKSSGTLDLLLSQGKEYVHVVSSDNVAAAVDPSTLFRIMSHLSQNNIEYCVEVTPTSSYLSKSKMVNQRQGMFELAEITRTVPKDSTEKFKFIDTRSLWVNLKAIRRLVDTDALKIENLSISKEMEGDQIVLQETAASSPMQLFDKVIGINVPQFRAVQLNATSDLLLLQSDLYSTSEGVLVRNTAQASPANPCIELGPEFEKVSDFQCRFKSIPSIVGLDSLKVAGDVWFGAGVILKGTVSIVAKPGMKLEIPDGAVLENKDINDPSDI